MIHERTQTSNVNNVNEDSGIAGKINIIKLTTVSFIATVSAVTHKVTLCVRGLTFVSLTLSSCGGRPNIRGEVVPIQVHTV